MPSELLRLGSTHIKEGYYVVEHTMKIYSGGNLITEVFYEVHMRDSDSDKVVEVYYDLEDMLFFRDYITAKANSKSKWVPQVLEAIDYFILNHKIDINCLEDNKSENIERELLFKYEKFARKWDEYETFLNEKFGIKLTEIERRKRIESVFNFSNADQSKAIVLIDFFIASGYKSVFNPDNSISEQIEEKEGGAE